MSRFLALTAVLVLAACTRQESPPPPATPPPPLAQTPPAAPAAPRAMQSETEQATASQESGDADTEHSPGDASLEAIAAAPAATPLPPGKWQAGVNYTLLLPAQPTSVPAGKVEVLEIFWLACPHCYALEPFIRDWQKTKPAYVEWVRVPVLWQQPPYRAHAHLYYTLAALGRQDLIAKAFDTIAQQHVMLASTDEDASFRLQQRFASDNGVSAADFATAYNSASVAASLRRAEELTTRYQVTSVPFIVVNGKYTTDLGKAAGGNPGGAEAKLIELINDLSAAEHGH
jgi:protein dithiol oxidoreductase (disulfide-forming)